MKTVPRGPAAEPTKTSGTMNVINDDARGPKPEGHLPPGREPEQETFASLRSKKGENTISAAEGADETDKDIRLAATGTQRRV